METQDIDSPGNSKEEPFLDFDVMIELSNPQFENWKHGSRHTYKHGCHGPLCRRADTLRNRQQTRRRCLAKGREYIPGNRDDSRAEELDAVIIWHHRRIASRKAREQEERELAKLTRKRKIGTWEAEMAS